MKSSCGKRERRVVSHRAVTQSPIGLDQQLGELMESVYACERKWSREDLIDAAIRFGRQL